ncbi:MAG: UrcA family protein [Sphingomonadaceae bacterium]|nr:UrcA family protein [Sphingomonadaceae bacterium]
MNAFGKIIAAVALAGSVAAHAQPSIGVDIGDLDLATAKGQKVMAMRIDRAARTLCASEAVSQSPAMIRAERACRAAAKEQALAAVATGKSLQVASSR